MLEELICILAVALTTAVAYLLGRILFAPKKGSLHGALIEALAEMMECLGAFVVFLIANVGLGVVLIITIRSLTSRFVSLYVIDNIVLIMLSALQGVVFRLWARGLSGVRGAARSVTALRN